LVTELPKTYRRNKKVESVEIKPFLSLGGGEVFERNLFCIEKIIIEEYS
jgi:hypothetical protein